MYTAGNMLTTKRNKLKCPGIKKQLILLNDLKNCSFSHSSVVTLGFVFSTFVCIWLWYRMFGIQVLLRFQHLCKLCGTWLLFGGIFYQEKSKGSCNRLNLARTRMTIVIKIQS